MRLAIVSDVHANLQAWKAVLLDIRSSGADEIICLGDLVGYGPDPVEVLESLHAGVNHFVLGNHDAAICGRMDAGGFNDRARRVLDWTRTRLGDAALAFLRTLPLSVRGDRFRCAHGDFTEPGAFHYVLECEDAAACWEAVEEPLLLVGHTHEPVWFGRASGRTARNAPAAFRLDDGCRYLVNVGSVGQPRDGDTRASYCLYDTAARSVEWRRIPFDIDAYRASVERRGLDPGTSYFLVHDPRSKAPPLRELLNFRPAETPEQAAQGAEEVREMAHLKRSVALWRTLVVVLLLAILGGAAAGGVSWWRHSNRALTLAHPGTAPLDAVRAPLGVNLLAMPATDCPNGTPVRGWTVRLGDKRRQRAAFEAEGTERVFVLASTTDRDEMRLSSPAVAVEPGMKLCIEGMIRKDPGVRGNVAVVLSLLKADDAGITRWIEEYVIKEPNLPRKGGWFAVRNTTDELPAGSREVRFHVRARFTGRACATDLGLTRTK